MHGQYLIRALKENGLTLEEFEGLDRGSELREMILERVRELQVIHLTVQRAVNYV